MAAESGKEFAADAMFVRGKIGRDRCPAIEVRRTDGAFVVAAAVAGVEASELDVQASSTELLITAPLRHTHPSTESDSDVLTCEFANGPLFRSLRFPAPVDPKRVKAEIRNGLLRVTAPFAGRTKTATTVRAPIP